LSEGSIMPCFRVLAAVFFATLFVALSSCHLLYRELGGDFAGPPSELWANASSEAKLLIADAYSDLDRTSTVDFHVHLAGTGSGSGIEIDDSWFHSCNPISRGRAGVYLSAAGVDDPERGDEQYLARLLDLLRANPHHGQALLYAMDRHYREDGTLDAENTPFHVPNDLVARVARENPDVFVPVVSVHPYRKDAIEELRRWGQAGVRFVKWIPNALGIDPSNPRIEPFYDEMKRHGMVLLSHTGSEKAFNSIHDQSNGNPLLLRAPLDRGVRVVALHSATDGNDVDLDHPDRPTIKSFWLFLRMMDNPKYEGLLFGEISAFHFFHRLGEPVDTLLARSDLHHRIVYGSDYPLAGINVLTQLGGLARKGYLEPDLVDPLREIYSYNPLLFDFVLKRNFRHPKSGRKFTASVFGVPEALRDAFVGSGG